MEESALPGVRAAAGRNTSSAGRSQGTGGGMPAGLINTSPPKVLVPPTQTATGAGRWLEGQSITSRPPTVGGESKPKISQPETRSS